MLTEELQCIERRDLPIWELPNGQPLTIPIFQIKGKGEGPNVYIQANIHGAEVQGNGIIFHLLNYFAENPPEGSVTLVPHANPFANSQKGGEHTLGRNDPTTGQNWNRYYIDLICKNEEGRQFVEQLNIEQFVEEAIALPWEELQPLFRKRLQEALQAYRERKRREGSSPAEMVVLPLQKMALEADLVLDLHTSPVGTNYAYVPEYAEESASYLQLPFLLLIPNIFDGALDEATFCPWWSLQEELIKRGRGKEKIAFESYTLEYGDQGVLDLEAARRAALGILSYLAYRGAVNGKASPLERCKKGFLKNYRTVYSERGGLIDFHVNVGDHVQKGDLIATILNLQLAKSEENLKEALLEVRSPVDGVILLRYPSASVHSGTELFKILGDVF